jgi:hypothetical protein
MLFRRDILMFVSGLIFGSFLLNIAIGAKKQTKNSGVCWGAA